MNRRVPNEGQQSTESSGWERFGRVFVWIRAIMHGSQIYILYEKKHASPETIKLYWNQLTQI